jgi:hypothetical protein
MSKLKTFFEKIGEWLKEIGHSATLEKTALTTLKVAAPLLDTLVGLVAGEPAEALVSKKVDQAQTDIAGAAALLSGASAGGAVTVTSFLGSVKTNLASLLADADVKNSTKATQIESTVNTVIGEVEAIQAAIEPPAASSTAAPAPVTA